MKNFLKVAAIFLAVFCFGACSDNGDNYTPSTLEVIPNNISGYWILAEYNGMEIPEGVFCYVQYIRKDKKFVMYQNFDSMFPRRITGTFSIGKDKYGKPLLGGKYDYGMGEWNNEYYVVELLENSMVLKADSDDAAVSKYVRCGGIPSEILDAVK